jgi:hypothetical protein
VAQAGGSHSSDTPGGFGVHVGDRGNDDSRNYSLHVCLLVDGGARNARTPDHGCDDQVDHGVDNDDNRRPDNLRSDYPHNDSSTHNNHCSDDNVNLGAAPGRQPTTDR